MHGGNDVQQVEGVAVGAASEQVLARPRHRAGGVVAVVDGREDDADADGTTNPKVRRQRPGRTVETTRRRGRDAGTVDMRESASRANARGTRTRVAGESGVEVE